MYERNRLGQMILEHWQTYRPQMVEELQTTNQLEQAIYEAQERTGDLLYELVSVRKMDYHAAWEMAMSEWALLPSQSRPRSSSMSSTPTTRQPRRPVTSG
ncbi:MAG TPA: hypothetical protein VMR62_07405 [Bryobacteraceae bacterium]|jgi:hypothetical protein|nr:hypothetical protein [Bryobacteraceae bacterium]